MLTLFSLAEVPLLKTGQTTVYAAYDDGHYQTGATRSYSRSGDVVKDNVTGLEWQDDVDSVSKNWEGAKSYCSTLSLDHGGWRLPTIEELETLVDDGRYNPSVTEGVFQHISSSYYWSSTTYANNTNYAWVVYFYYGGSYSGAKTYGRYVRCVRGGQ